MAGFVRQPTGSWTITEPQGPSERVIHYLKSLEPPTPEYMSAIANGLDVIPIGKKGAWPNAAAKLPPSMAERATTAQPSLRSDQGSLGIGRPKRTLPSIGSAPVIRSLSTPQSLPNISVRTPPQRTGKQSWKMLREFKDGLTVLNVMPVDEDGDGIPDLPSKSRRERSGKPRAGKSDGSGYDRNYKTVSTAPAWWQVPEPATEAADAFDRRHNGRYALGDKMMLEMRAAPRESLELRFHAVTFEIRTNRYFVPEVPAVTTAIIGKRRAIKPKPWDIRKSIWAPREHWCDAKDFYDTEEVEGRRFGVDVDRLLACDLTKAVLTYDDDADPYAQDEDGDGIPDEVEDVIDVLWTHHDLIFVLFSYFAAYMMCCDSMALNEWTVFTEVFKLMRKGSKFAKRADLDRVFIATNAMTTNAAKKGSLSKAADASLSADTKDELNRIEFYMALVRLAIQLYVQPKVYTDVSDALERLIAKDLHGMASSAQSVDDAKGVFVDPNEFRRLHCYCRETDAALRQHEKSLRNLFEALSSSDDKNITTTKGLLSNAEWLSFVRAAELLSSDLSLRDATLCFAWSRMAVVDSRTRKGRDREVSLPFEGFLEALCRMAALKALPTQAELDATHCESAADFFSRLEAGTLERPGDMDGSDDGAGGILTSTEWCTVIARKRAVPWGGEPGQPVHVSVRMIVSIILSRIEVSSKTKADNVITEREARNWTATFQRELA